MAAGQRSKRRWSYAAAILLAALLLLGWHFWFRRDTKRAEAAVTPQPTQPLTVVTVVKPSEGATASSLTLPATVDAWYQTTLYAKVTGYVTSIMVDKGDLVHKGETLATLDVPEVDQEYDRAKAAVEQAQANLKSAQVQAEFKQTTYNRVAHVRQARPDVLAVQDLDAASAAFQTAQADANLAQANLRMAQAEVGRLETLRQFAQVKAPFDGIITARSVDPGALIQEGGSTSGTPLLVIADLSTVRVYVDVPGTDVAQIKRRSPVTVFLDAIPGQGLRGSITRFADALDPQTRTMKTEIDLPNPGHRILPGMYGTVRLDLAQRAARLWVPTSCIRHDAAGQAFVFVVEHGRVHRKPAKVGLSSGGMTQVRGVSSEDVVVLSATANLQNGVQVTPVPAGA